MTDIVERLRARVEIAERESRFGDAEDFREAADEIERLRAVIMRAKDALLDGQSTQRVHDLLVAALLGPKP